MLASAGLREQSPRGGREAGGVEVGGEGGRGSSVAVPTVVVAPLTVKAVLAMVETMVEKERLVVEERGNRGWWWRRRRWWW